MSDEFQKIARQEIQSDLDGLNNIIVECIDDEYFFKKIKNIEKHMHNIKGLAPMMSQEKVGEIARISDVILKYIINQGTLNGSQEIIFEAIQRMSLLFNGNINLEIEDFRKKVMNTYPNIRGI